VAKAGRSFRLLYIYNGTGYTSPTSPGKEEEKKNERDNEE